MVTFAFTSMSTSTSTIMFPRFRALVVVLLLSVSVSVLAHSESARPLKRLAHPSTLALEILPRHPQPLSSSSSSADIFKRSNDEASKTLRHDDTFRLVLSAFSHKIHLHLRPNDHLIHPAARISYHALNADGRTHTTHTEPLLRESVRVYWGEVIREEDSLDRLREDAARVTPRPNWHPSVLGWARIMVHEQGADVPPVYEGAFSMNGDIYHIVTKDNYLRNKHAADPELAEPVEEVDGALVIWRESDVMGHAELAEHSAGGAGLGCGHDKLEYNTDPMQNPLLRQRQRKNQSWLSGTIFDGPPFANMSGLTKRQDDAGNRMGTNFIDNIGDTVGCPTSQKILYMGVASDCRFTQQYGSKDNATRQILTDWNTATSLYKSSFNVSLGIVELQVSDPTCPTTPNPAIPWNIPCDSAVLNTRLSLFSQWRGAKGGGDGAGLWHLMSGCPTGTEVGIAWLGTLCKQDSGGSGDQVVSGTGVSTSGRTEWQVIAHEIGHNFGGIHDCTDGCTRRDACCPLSVTTCDADARFIMSPVAQPGEKLFSPCSVGNICALMAGVDGDRTNTTCLVDPDSAVKTISLQMCGNGIIEGEEECDPGQGVDSACCDSTTCKFKAGAVCDPLSTRCCTDQCGFAPATRVCRVSRDAECDSEERCTGSSALCPRDLFKGNGETCGGSGEGLTCASGICTSVGRQCATIGASMNLTRACANRGDGTCQISCQDPTRSNACLLLSSMLIDGSPCGYGGLCASGTCQAGSALDTAKAWYTQNLQISIPVTVVAGLFVLLVLWGIIRCLRRSCSRARDRARSGSVGGAAGGMRYAEVRHERLGSYDATQAPRVPTEARPGVHHTSRSRSNWVDEGGYNGAGYGAGYGNGGNNNYGGR